MSISSYDPRRLGVARILDESPVPPLRRPAAERTARVTAQGVPEAPLKTQPSVDFTGAPALPERPATASSMRSAVTSTGLMETAEELENAALMWHALSELARTALREQKDAKELKGAMQRGKVGAKSSALGAQAEEIAASRGAATVDFAFSVAGAVASAAISSTGASAAEAQQAAALGKAASDVITGAGKFINRVSGPQARADEKKLEQQRQQMMQEHFEQGLEGAKANYEEARELFKLAMKIITEHCERQTQISNTVTRT